MTTLIRTQSHGNEVSVIYLSKPDIYRKVSYSQAGQKYICNENKGIMWYSNLFLDTHKNFIKGFWLKDHYSRIDLHRIKGKKINYNSSLKANEETLNLCLDHYFDLWPKNEISPCHGDLTLDNVIISNDGVTFFDWEHFFEEGEQWGFDIAYLILSAAFLPYHNNGEIPNKDCVILHRLWQRLINNGLKGDLAEIPMDDLRKKFQTNSHWLDISSCSPRKLFPLWSDTKFNQYLHDIIN